MRRWRWIWVWLCIGCGTQPKPAELIAFEQDREGAYTETIRARYPGLTAETDQYYRQALRAFEAKKDDATIHAVRLARITWRTAVALSQTRDQRDAQLAGQAQQRIADAEQADAQKRLTLAQVALARFERRIQLQHLLESARRKTRADPRKAKGLEAELNAAIAHLNAADAVDAAVFANTTYVKAYEALLEALDACENTDFIGSFERATRAQLLAAEAKKIAEPRFKAVEPVRQIDAELRHIIEAATGIPTATAHLEPQGAVITLTGGFGDDPTVLHPRVAEAVSTLAALAQAHPRLSIRVEAHTDNRGAPADNEVRSRSQAKLIGRLLQDNGVPATQITTHGLGGNRPIADNMSRQGRAQNQRVTVTFVRPQPIR